MPMPDGPDQPAQQAQQALVDAAELPGGSFDDEVGIEHVRFVSEDGQFAVIEVSLPDGSSIPAVGPIGHLEGEDRARIVGTFEDHSRHGPQIAATEAVPLDPTGAEGARRYLRSLPGIGAKRAAKLVEMHGADGVFAAIDRDPQAAFGAIPGLSEEKARRAAVDWNERRAERRLYALLAPHGLARHVGELVAIHGSGAPEQIRDDPYSLSEVQGIGFQSADRVALASGVEPGSARRTGAAAVHALREGESRGHTHLPSTELVVELRRLLGTEPSLGHIASTPELTIEGQLVYRDWTHRAERWLGATFARMARAEPAWSTAPPLDSEVLGLTDSQQVAVANALTRRLSVITGGPGTGKTHLTDTLARMATTRELKIRLLAPTGRAARRLTQATNGEPASTIHKALEWIPGELPGRDEDSPVEADLVIVDESSMLSLELCRHLIAAIGPDTHLVLIGDADQLPPVGPGKPFCELIDSGIAPAVRLDHVFRQARRSMIVGAAHSIRTGERPRSEPGEDEVRDFYLHGKPRADALADDVVRMVVERIPSQFGLDPVRQVQVLAPQYRGALGIDALHVRLRDALCGEETCLDGRFRIGEKVIATRSLPELGIANGTSFVIEEADEEDSELLLETDLGEFVKMPYRDARTLRGGFCTSVHKAQGNEIPAVIVCLHSSHAPRLLSRNLLYTAVTRAQRLCVLAGDERALTRALANTDATDRHSRLIERMTG